MIYVYLIADRSLNQSYDTVTQTVRNPIEKASLYGLTFSST